MELTGGTAWSNNSEAKEDRSRYLTTDNAAAKKNGRGIV